MSLTDARPARGDVRDLASVRLRTMVQQRPMLMGGYEAALARRGTSSHAEIELWAASVLMLANVNAGPAALLAAFHLTATAGSPRAFARMAGALEAAAAICRGAGAGATLASLDAYRDFGLGLEEDARAAWWRGMVQLAKEAPNCLASAATTTGPIVRDFGAATFEAFVTAALRATREPDRRQALLALSDPEARRLLERLSGEATFQVMQPRLQAFAMALWGRAVSLREMPAPTKLRGQRRASFSAPFVYVPDVGGTASRAPRLYEAIVAHATAHLVLGDRPFDPGKLKPIQLALVGLIEDARIEALAMRRFPGLFRLWAPFHTVEPSHLKTAPMILARLSRALFDPAYVDDDAIVAKGRALFVAEPTLDDPILSRRIGDVLGNDIGQMRIRFDALQHVIEPIYRDDNLGLWQPRDDADTPALDMPLDPARPQPEERENSGGDPDAASHETNKLWARSLTPDERGPVIAHYAEWDRAAGIERPDWTTIRATPVLEASTIRIDQSLAQHAGLSARVSRLVRAARVGLPTRLRRQPDGPELDLDAAVDAVTALRVGQFPGDRLHQRKITRTRDLAVLILVDTSESTRDPVPTAGINVLAAEQIAVAVLAQAMESQGDRFALRAFASDGRDDVRYIAIKDFSAPFDRGARARLAGLRSGLSTRLGAALRHAGTELAKVAAIRRVMIVLTDGAPSDIDVADPDDLVVDARRAVLTLHRRGIDVFGLTLDPNGQGAGAAAFGRSNHMPVRRIEELPDRLASVYFRIARR